MIGNRLCRLRRKWKYLPSDPEEDPRQNNGAAWVGIRCQGSSIFTVRIYPTIGQSFIIGRASSARKALRQAEKVEVGWP